MTGMMDKVYSLTILLLVRLYVLFHSLKELYVEPKSLSVVCMLFSFNGVFLNSSGIQGL